MPWVIMRVDYTNGPPGAGSPIAIVEDGGLAAEMVAQGMAARAANLALDEHPERKAWRAALLNARWSNGPSPPPLPEPEWVKVPWDDLRPGEDTDYEAVEVPIWAGRR